MLTVEKRELICYPSIVVTLILNNQLIIRGVERALNTDDHPQANPAKDQAAVLRNLLGSLELEAMEYMWQEGEATVRQVVDSIGCRRSVAYTTVMTVMGHLVDKGLLSRTLEKKRYRYRVNQGKNEFLHQSSQRAIRTLVDDFGDLAVAGFLSEISEINPGKLEELGRLIRETRGGTSAHE